MLEIIPDVEILYAFLGVLILIMVNALLGILRAVVDRTFQLDHIADFLRNHVLFDGGALLILGAAAVAQPQAKVLFFAATAAGGVKYLGKIKEKLSKAELVE